MLRILCVLLMCGAAWAQPKAKMVWADEFDGTGLPDKAKWVFETGGHGWGNQELQFYTRDRVENARQEGGRLIIEARKEAWEGREYTSARLVTKGVGEWKYGWIEARAKVPCGRGTWPAIWMLGFDLGKVRWPQAGEIDIMEHVGFDPGVVHGTVHTGAYNHAIKTHKGGKVAVADACEAFHTYAVEWTAEKMEFFMDGKAYFRFENEHKTAAEWPFDKPFYLLLNVAVGGTWGGQKGVDSGAFPQRMEVDWVRVYDRRPE